MSDLSPCPWPVERLLPHRAPMLLLDTALGFSASAAVAAATIRADHPFATPLGVPAHVGIELMAQTCGVYIGARALAAGQPVRLGFLLGTRGFQAETDWFAVGDRLEVAVRASFLDDEMGVFDCRIDRAGQAVAQAQLTVFQPDDAAAVLARMRGNDV